MIKKYDVIEASYMAFRLAQGLTSEQLKNWLQENKKHVISERMIGVYYTEVTVS